MREIGFVSLFSGAGGFDLGIEEAGLSSQYQCEIDPACRSVLERVWPSVPRWDDVSTLSGAQILSQAQNPEVIVWGSPCQDLSVAGKRAGLAGERSGLFYEGIRIIREMREASDGRYPRISVWENVRGALSSNGGADFGAVLDAMAELGSVVIEWAVLDAQFFGIAQRRKRVFVVAVLDPALASRCADPLLPVGEGVRGNPAARRAARETTTGAAQEGSAGDSQWAAGSSPDGILRQSITSKWSKGSSGPSGDEYMNLVIEPFVKARRAQSSEDPESWVPGDVSPTLNAWDQGDTRATTVIASAYSIREDAQAGNFSVTELDHANALSAVRPSPQFHHAQMFIAEQEIAVRRLTPIECERLMGWPDDHTRWRADGSEQPDSQRYRQIGNGVASPVARWIGEQIVPMLEGA